MVTAAERFHRLRVDDVMVPRADIVAVDSSSTLTELSNAFKTAGHSRLPVYKETLDEPTGMVHIKDLLPYLCLLYTSPSPRDGLLSRMPSSA